MSGVWYYKWYYKCGCKYDAKWDYCDVHRIHFRYIDQEMDKLRQQMHYMKRWKESLENMIKEQPAWFQKGFWMTE